MSCQCDGRCCAVFTYTSTPEELRARPWKNSDSQQDNLYIADMLVRLTAEEAQERAERFGIDKAIDYSKSQQYTCSHWNESTMLCEAYDERPRMCREYPYDRTCDHGCGYVLPSDLLAAYDRRQIESGFVTNIVLGEN